MADRFQLCGFAAAHGGEACLTVARPESYFVAAEPRRQEHVSPCGKPEALPQGAAAEPRAIASSTIQSNSRLGVS